MIFCDHDPVTDQQRVLHRLRRDDEHLPDERPQQGRHHDRADDHDQQLAGEPPGTRPDRFGWLLLRLAASRTSVGGAADSCEWSTAGLRSGGDLLRLAPALCRTGRCQT